MLKYNSRNKLKGEKALRIITNTIIKMLSVPLLLNKTGADKSNFYLSNTIFFDCVNVPVLIL